MTGKDVHVKSYTRDGEKVREHWRSHPDSGIDDVVSSVVKQAVLRGGVEHTDISLDSIVDVIRDIANKGKDAWNKIPKPIKTVLAQALIQSALYNPSSAANARVVTGEQRLRNVATNNDLSATKLRGGVEINEYRQKNTQENPDNIMKNNEKEYPPAKINVQSKPKIKNINYTQTNSDKLNSQQYNTEIFKSQLENMYANAGKNHDIDLKNKEMWIEKPKFETYIPKELLGIVDEIISFPRKNFKNIIGNIFDKDLSRNEKTLRILKPYIMSSPHISKATLGNGGQVVDNMNYKNAKPAAKLLMASVDFGKYANRIEFAKVVSSYKETGPIQDFVKEKIISQNMDPNNTPGIIHSYKSEMSQALAHSKEIRQYISKYRKALLQQQLIPTVSEKFDSTKNLYWGINRADILLSYIDNNNDLNIIIIDTYDFNKNDPSLLVNIAYSPQSANLITRYFNVFQVKIPYGRY